MTLTQETLDRAALIVVVGKDGLWEWSSDRHPTTVVGCLRVIADMIEEEERRSA